MSFKEYASAVSLANRALGMISESKTISSLDDPGLNAQVIRRWYKPVVARLLEMHHWGLATKRAPLISITNDRASEWNNAYTPPEDMAFPVGVSLMNGASSVSYYVGLAGIIATSFGRPIFQYQNGVLYSNLAGDLEYVSYDVTEADFNSTLQDIIVTMLAARCAREIPKDLEMAKELEATAERAINVAITQNLNSGNRKYGQVTSEAELVRGTLIGDSWDYYPRGPGA